MSRLGKLLRLGRRGWWDLLTAQIALVRAQGELRWRPIGALVRREVRAEVPARGDAVRAHEVARAVSIAASHGVFRPRCLARALALRDLLAREGVTGSEIRVGVRRHDGRFLAHAWVVWNGAVLGDDPAWVQSYTEVNDLRVLKDA